MNMIDQLKLQEKFNNGGFAKLAKPLTVEETKTLVEKPVKQTRKSRAKK